jgi:hypothetical protein
MKSVCQPKLIGRQTLYNQTKEMRPALQSVAWSRSRVGSQHDRGRQRYTTEQNITAHVIETTARQRG